MVLMDGRWDVWDVRADTVVEVASVESERGGLCHQAAGSNIYVGGDCWETGFLARPLDDPHDFTHLVSLYKSDGVTKSWDQDVHVSINQWDERYFISSLYSYPDGDWTPWEQEILAIATDGSWVVRLAHHHSDVLGGGYYASPRVSISYDGRYATFTSSWDGVGMDVFLLELPILCDSSE